DVRVVERRLDLVEQVERARPREEQREQERDRAERLLAAGEQRQPGDALPGRPQLDLDARLLALLLRLGEAQPPPAAREARRGDLVEVLLDRRERLGEARLDGVGELVAELLELAQAVLEVAPLPGELLEPLLLRLVLLLRERVHLPELLEPALRPLQLLRQLVAVLALRRLGAGGVEPPLRLVALRVGARELDVDRGELLARRARRLAQLELAGAQPAQLRAQLAGAGGLPLGPGADGLLEPLRVEDERLLEPRRGGVQPLEDELARPARPVRVGVGERPRGGAGALGSQLGRGRGLARPPLEILGLLAQEREVASRRGRPPRRPTGAARLRGRRAPGARPGGALRARRAAPRAGPRRPRRRAASRRGGRRRARAAPGCPRRRGECSGGARRERTRRRRPGPARPRRPPRPP